MNLRKTSGAVAAVWMISLVLGAPTAFAGTDDEPEIKGRDAKNLTGFIERYYDYLEKQNYAGTTQMVKEIDGVLDKLAKSWKVGDGDGRAALQHIDAFVDVLNTFPKKWEGGFKKDRLEEGETPDGTKFHIYLPKTYKDRPKSLADFYPAIVDLRPAGEAAESYFDKNWAGQKVLESTILILPSPPETGDWATDEGISNALQPLGDLSWNKVPIHQDAMFLCGSGKTAPATARIAARFAERFAGVVFRTGGSAEDYLGANLGRISVLTAEDSPLTQASATFGGSVKKGQVDGDALAEFVSTTRRNRYPESVSGVIPNLSWGDATWLKVRQIDVTDAEKPSDYPTFRASLDRENNKIKIDSKGISKFYLRLNDEVVDLDKNVVVEINGQEVFNAIVKRDLDELLKTAYYTGDRGRLWVRIREIEVPVVDTATAGDGADGGQPKDDD